MIIGESLQETDSHSILQWSDTPSRAADKKQSIWQEIALL
jgi:hypothetical protein